jgi:hypothetical protein
VTALPATLVRVTIDPDAYAATCLGCGATMAGGAIAGHLAGCEAGR